VSGLGSDPRVRDLLRQAQQWRLLGLLFERPREDWWAQVAALGATCDGDELRAAAAAARSADEGTFLALVGPGGAVSAREVGHRPVTDPGHLLAALQAFYAAFAFAPESEEPPDHVSVEAGFVGFLRLKEAFALAADRAEEARLSAEAAASFLADHLAAIAEPLCLRLEACGDGYLAAAGRALFASVGPRTEVEAGWAPTGLDTMRTDDVLGCEDGCGRMG
jgi:nitrate reductase assembly molybdenum cofactor insertion protein NarJ